MTEFWIICALLLAVALLFVAWPLWRSAAKNNDVVRDAANLEILRDQLAELDTDLANGLLTQEAYEQGKRELQVRVLDEVESPKTSGAQARNPIKALAVALAVVVPLTSVGLYWKLGNLNVFLPQNPHAVGAGNVTLSDTAIQELQAKLEKKPDDPEGWLLLARSLDEKKRFDEAVKAYEKLTELVPNEAQLWADYADSLAMTNGQSLKGRPTELLERALAIDPNHEKALALAGSAAMERGDYATAVRYWEKLLQQMPDKNSELAQEITQGIQMAHSYLTRTGGGKGKAMEAASKERISGTVALSAGLKAKAAPDDTVFVLARAASGPPMPLAVIRRQVKDLPLQFTLDDSMAMTQQMKISSFDRVVVIARVSKSGDAMPQPGDLQGMSPVIKPGSAKLKINIDSMVQ